VRRSVKRTLCPRLVGVMMDARHKAVAGRVVMILALEMCQVVVCFLRDGPHPAVFL